MIQTRTTRPHIKGNFFNNRHFTFPFSIANCVIIMQFKQGIGNRVVFSWSTEDDSFERISDFKIKMKGKILNYAVGTYISDLLVIFPDNVPYTQFKYNIEIVQNITENQI